MYLNKDEEKMLDGESGIGYQYAMKLLVRIGDVLNADKFVNITRAHWGLSGQEGDLYFAKKLAEGGASATVPITTNPAWDEHLKAEFKVSLSDYELSLLKDTIDVCDKLKVIKSFSCTPYLASDHPVSGEHVAFSESSAPPYINSVYGAMTNRESSASALAAGIIGKTPNYGLHLQENRKPTVLVDVKADIKNDFDFGILGWHIGKIIEANSIPYLINLRHVPSPEALRDFGALINTTNAIAMFHIADITPEAKKFQREYLPKNKIERVEVSNSDIESVKKEFARYHGEINSVYMGCPLSTLNEIVQVYKLLNGRAVNDKVSFLIFTSSTNFMILKEDGMLDKLGSLGVKVLKDSCVDEPVFKFTEGKLGITNSAKAAYYRERRNQKFSILEIPDIVEAAVKGYI